jgi:hypothetical protein
LKQWEDETTYHLVGGPQPDSGGAVNGHVIRLGRNARFIVAQRAATAGGDTAWIVVDVNRREVSAPMTDTDIASRPEVARLATYRVDSAWAQLR